MTKIIKRKKIPAPVRDIIIDGVCASIKKASCKIGESVGVKVMGKKGKKIGKTAGKAIGEIVCIITRS